MTPRTRVLTAARLPVRAAIAIALRGRVELCAQVGDASDAIRAAMREQPDVCLIASELPGGGLAAVRGVARAAPEAAVLVLADADEPGELIDAVRAGAMGYVRDPSPESLRKIVRAISANEAVVPRSMVRELLLELRHGGSGGDGLSAREAQVLAMLRRGSSTSEIADRLKITPVTVRRHISGVVRKLGVPDRAAVVSR